VRTDNVDHFIEDLCAQGRIFVGRSGARFHK
jgi:hypothetical protein